MNELELYLERNNIKQIHLSKALLEHKNSILRNVKVAYDNIYDPTLFYGMYRDNDIEAITNHKGVCYILWHDNDCNPEHKSRINNVEKIKKLYVKEHICYYNKTSLYLDKLEILHHNIKSGHTFENCANNSDNSGDTNVSDSSNILVQSENVYTVNDIFEKVYIINMTKDTHKKENMKNKMHSLGIKYEFFEGIDGSTEPYICKYNEYNALSYDHPNAHYYEQSRNSKAIRSSGAYGYLLTWKKILEKSIEKGYENILVFDDDVMFDKDFNIKFNKFIDKVNKDWKIITLGVSQHVWGNVNIKDSYYVTPEYTDGSFAIGINSSVFSALLNETNKFNCAFDSGPVRYIYKKYNTKCFTSYPNIVIADVSVSTIGGPRDMIEFSRKVKWNLHNFSYKHSIGSNDPFLVTVIVPMYNSESTISMSLQSLVNQTYHSLEIIVVNDASTDKSKEQVEKFVEKHNNVRLINLKENSGCYVARNTGIKAAKGNYIGFHDADDVSLPMRIEKQVKILMENNVLLCGCNFSRLQEEFNLDNVLEQIKIQQKNYNECKARFGLVTILFKKSVFDLYGLYRDDYRHSMDAEFIERIYFKLYGKLSKTHIHTLLCTNNVENKEFYYKLDELLYVSTPMTHTNISSTYGKNVKENVRKKVIRDILENNVKID